MKSPTHTRFREKLKTSKSSLAPTHILLQVRYEPSALVTNNPNQRTEEEFSEFRESRGCKIRGSNGIFGNPL